MEEKKLIAFLFQTLLKEEFGSKRAMARKLDIQLRTLQENFQHLHVAKGGTVAFERLILYCVEQKIDIWLDALVHSKHKQTIPTGT